jgi:CheY-like chemotaxis protein/RNase P/RNase MRP subunit POP5
MKSILFADDNKNIREFCKLELEDDGYRVFLACDGKEATRFAQTQHLDLAILDISMPIMGGLEAAERIKAIAPSVPIMFFTAHDDVCVRAGDLAMACVEKSDDLTELKHAITQLLTIRDGNEPFRSGLPMRTSADTVDPPAGSVSPTEAGQTGSLLHPVRRSLSCEVHGDTVTADGPAWSYYVSQQGSRPILVVRRRKGERLRINGGADLIVLGIEHDHVRLAIESRRIG